MSHKNIRPTGNFQINLGLLNGELKADTSNKRESQ
jgi:hypothetical protein